MSYTPVEIRHVRLGRGLLGYGRKAVDHLLAEVTESFEAVWRERADLADKSVVVGGVELVVAGPGPFDAQGLERRDAFGQGRPDLLVEEREVRVERQVVVIVLLGRHDGAQEVVLFRTHEDAGGIDENRSAL